MKPAPPIPVQAAQAIAASMVFAGVALMAAVGRGVFLLLGPDSTAVFEQTSSGSANAAAYSVILGYGVPALAFTVLYAVLALRVTRGRRWTWVLGMVLGIVGVVLCFTTVSKLLSFVGLALGVFQALLAVLLLAGFRYFWSSPAAAGAGVAADPTDDDDGDDAPAAGLPSDADSEPASDAGSEEPSSRPSSSAGAASPAGVEPSA
jgi:hypothetical protein